VRRPWAWALALVILYAITDEFHQGLVAGRHPSSMDVAIEAVGVLTAILVVSSVVHLRRRPRRA
jgi:VanZ family protein